MIHGREKLNEAWRSGVRLINWGRKPRNLWKPNMNKFLAFCLAITGFAGLPLADAAAHGAPTAVAATTTTPVNALPATVRINEIVVIRTHHRRYRRVRRVYFRHGRRIVVYRTVYY